MKLHAEIKNNLRRLDFEYGGGITVEGTQVDMIDKPVLIVGLGGTGVEALIRVKDSINKHFKSQTGAYGRKLDKPANIEYLAIDSDDNMQNIKFNGMEFNKEYKEFVLLESAHIMTLYKDHKNSSGADKDITKDWIADNLRFQQVKHGAGGIRQAGRFLLFTNINIVINTITEKINRLTLNRETNDLLYVFILTGTSGGTGGGTFIDIPYIIRKISEDKGFESEIVGLIFLPDVTLSSNTIDGSAAINIKANGFASLKELDYLMNLEHNGEYFQQNYADIKINTNIPPFDLCHLISAKDETGLIKPSAKNYCMNVAAEAIINFIASEEIIDGQNYTINSYLSNIENNRSAFLMTHNQKQPINYVYNIVGASSAVLPINFLANYLTHKVFKELEPLFDKAPNNDSVEQTMQTLKIDPYSIERAMEIDKPKLRDLARYDYSILEKHPDKLDEALQDDILNFKDHLEARCKEIVDELQMSLAEKNNLFNQHFLDFEQGPFYTLQELSPVFENSVLREIEQTRKYNNLLRKDLEITLADLELKKNAELEKLQKGSFKFFKKRNTEQLIKTSERIYKAATKSEYYHTIDKMYESIYQTLAVYGDQRIDTLCELLAALKELFDKFKNPDTAQVSESFTWDLISIKELCEYVENDKELCRLMEPKKILKQFLQELVSKPEVWVSSERSNVTQNLNVFITRELEVVLRRSVDFFLTAFAKAKHVPIDQFIGEKIEKLRSTANVMFPLNHIPTKFLIEFPPYAYLSIPSNAPNIRTKVKEMTASGGSANMKHSKMTNRIYMLNLKIAVALCCYTELNDYEKAYEASLLKVAGLHLYEGKDKNWRALPSPNYDKLWTTGYENPREREKNRKIRETFQQGLQYGYIKLDAKNQFYRCVYGEHWDVSDKFGINEKVLEDKALSASGARLLSAEIKHWLEDTSRLKYEQIIYDYDMVNDDEYAQGVFIYMPALNAAIASEVANHQRALLFLEKLGQIEQTEVKYSNFAQIMYMKKIFKSRRNFKYQLDKEDKILYTMVNMQERYMEYELFQAFLAMTKKESTYIQKKAQEAENSCTDQQFEDVIKVIDSFLDVYEGKYSELKRSYLEERDGEQKMIFYKTMLEVFEKAKEALLQ